MSLLWRWLKRFGLVLFLLVLSLGAPVLYVETMCRGDGISGSHTALLPPKHRRPETRTFMTYPEWHIVHAYDDYAKVIASQDPHDFEYLQSISGYWASLCALSKTAAEHGVIDSATKQLVYVIGVSFTLEFALKATYEETIGRLATLIRGGEHAPLDDLSATQAAQYAKFLQQVPWYKWDFTSANTALRAASAGSFRDRERAFALGAENSAKSAYAGMIAAAVASTGGDQLTLRMIVSGVSREKLSTFAGVQIISPHGENFEIETPRYRALTHLLQAMAAEKITFVEIAGNDDILFTALSEKPDNSGAIHSFARQGYGDFRHLMVVKTAALSGVLRALSAEGLTLEHIHDY